MHGRASPAALSIRHGDEQAARVHENDFVAVPINGGLLKVQADSPDFDICIIQEVCANKLNLCRTRRSSFVRFNDTDSWSFVVSEPEFADLSETPIVL